MDKIKVNPKQSKSEVIKMISRVLDGKCRHSEIFRTHQDSYLLMWGTKGSGIFPNENNELERNRTIAAISHEI